MTRPISPFSLFVLAAGLMTGAACGGTAGLATAGTDAGDGGGTAGVDGQGGQAGGVGGTAGGSGQGGTGGSSLHWYTTCGEPVCQAPIDGGSPISGVSACTAEHAGDACGDPSASCDPGLGCGVLLACSVKDPKVQLGGCPVSRRAAKEDIVYLDDAALDRLAVQLRALRLAKYRYRDNPARERLGFVIDDGAGTLAVDGPRDQIDLYAYMSWAVGALQVQMRRIDAQEREIASMRRRLGRRNR